MYLFYFDIHCSSELFFKVDQIRVVINAIDHRPLSKEKKMQNIRSSKSNMFSIQFLSKQKFIIIVNRLMAMYMHIEARGSASFAVLYTCT